MCSNYLYTIEILEDDRANTIILLKKFFHTSVSRDSLTGVRVTTSIRGIVWPQQYYYLTLSEFLPPAIADDFSLEFDGEQILYSG